MDPLWSEFRASPATFLNSHRTNIDSLVQDLLQVITSDSRNIHLKLSVLTILQESSSFLLGDKIRLDGVFTALKAVFNQQRNTGDSVFVGQILVTMTTILIEKEDELGKASEFLVPLVTLLLEIIEKLKSESNRFLRAVACQCLKELETLLPGLLAEKVGHFFGMSQAENSFIHQHYLALFAVVLKHAIQKLALQNEGLMEKREDETSSLEHILSYTDRLMPYHVPSDFNFKFEECHKVAGMGDPSELQRGVNFLIDHTHLFTSPLITQVVFEIMDIIHCSPLSPTMLKGIWLKYGDTMDLQLLQLVLILKLNFGAAICDEGDAENILRRLVIYASHSMLPSYQCALAMQWLTQLTGQSQECLPDLLVGEVMDYSPLLPHVFDNNEVCWLKIKVLMQRCHQSGNEKCLGLLKEVLSCLQLPVMYGVGGAAALLLHRSSLCCYQTFQKLIEDDIVRLLVNILISHPEFTPLTMNMLATVEKTNKDSALPVMVLSELCQWLLSMEAKALLAAFPSHLILLTAAARHKHIKPQVPLQILSGVVQYGGVCHEGVWAVGNGILSVCCTLMRSHSTAEIADDLAHLLLIIAKEFMDIDIRDRASFYLQVLLNVSSEKLSLLLSESDGLDLSQIVVARISNNVYPVAPAITLLPNTVVSLTRLSQDKMTQSQIFSPTDPTHGSVLAQYVQWLSFHECDFTVQLPCIISLCEEDGSSVGDRVYALVVQINTPMTYRPTPVIQIPSLSSGEYVHRTVTLIPIRPYPATFTIRSVFTTDDGKTCSSSMKSLELNFTDLFQSPPMSKEKVSLQNLFNLLWAHIEENQHSQESVEKEGALSVGSYPNKDGNLLNSLSEKLYEYLVARDKESVRFLVYLPPKYHVLLKMTSKEDSLVVHIATDYWRLLLFVGSFLTDLSTECV